MYLYLKLLCLVKLGHWHLSNPFWTWDQACARTNPHLWSCTLRTAASGVTRSAIQCWVAAWSTALWSGSRGCCSLPGCHSTCPHMGSCCTCALVLPAVSCTASRRVASRSLRRTWLVSRRRTPCCIQSNPPSQTVGHYLSPLVRFGSTSPCRN